MDKRNKTKLKWRNNHERYHVPILVNSTIEKHNPNSNFMLHDRYRAAAIIRDEVW